MVAVDTMAIRRVIQPQPASLQVSKTGRMTIAPDVGGSTLSIPYAPREVTHSNLAADFVIVERPGLRSYVTYQNPQLPTMSVVLKVADKSTSLLHITGGETVPTTTQTAIGVITQLQAYADAGQRLRVTYGAFESGLWYITSMSVRSITRDKATDEITFAEVDLGFTKAMTSPIGTGPTTGGVTPPPSTSVPVTPTPAPSRTYVTKRGDTLWAIAIKYYGNGNKWTIIADANGIKNPRLMGTGITLRIP